MKMNFREHVRADVAKWPPELRSLWAELVSTNNFYEWAKYPTAEVELRAWLELRNDVVAREPVVLNYHHLTPSAPQSSLRGSWPSVAVYCGRPTSSAPALTERGGEGWRYSHLLHNPYHKDVYPDALERYRRDIRGWMREDNAAATMLAAGQAARHHPSIDAIRDLTPRSALVCSCVQSPLSPLFRAQPGEKLPPEVTCHCHLIVAAWRALQTNAIVKEQT